MHLPLSSTEPSPDAHVENNTDIPNHSKTSGIHDKVIDQAGMLLQEINPPMKALDSAPSMVNRVRYLTEDGVLRVANALTAIARKLGKAEKIFFDNLPQAILSIPSQHDRKKNDDALILKAKKLLNSMKHFTECFKELLKGIEIELKRLAEREEFSNFTDPLMDYQDFYLSKIPEIERITHEYSLLATQLMVRVRIDVERGKHHQDHTIAAFCLCYGFKPIEALTSIMDMHNRSDKIADFISALKETSKSMENANAAFRDEYNFLAHLCINEIHYDGSDKEILNNFKNDYRNYLDSSSDYYKQTK